ncbi:MAG: response regulator [Rhodospirillales bacterium]|jgi:two-component system, cell cycle response regulator DivK|nr:response regulator [Rhodospirillales bacterium]MBT4039197.1 response regulator [Rhodospirillales bacterium]MBT4625610.1 response regulator [Rhodospirillales bacterium]MBT5351477.1 response regulator [Rhodospirillales bacterium]MBT5521440.1 response regulator [Rhodospirillales bacterium]
MAKVLVVDDDEVICGILRALLESKGHQVIEASSGSSAVDMARSEKPDLIILDMNMPDMTGWETIPVIRSHPDTKNTPIVALTADSTADGHEEAHLAGCDRYVTKPFDDARLFAALDGLL